jgi:hypothetical protein
MYSLRRLNAAAFGTLMSLEPAIAVLAGLLVLDQIPRVWSLLGVAFVVAAGIGAERAGARSHPEPPPVPRPPAPSGSERVRAGTQDPVRLGGLARTGVPRSGTHAPPPR